MGNRGLGLIVADGKTSILDSTDSSAAIAISGSFLLAPALADNDSRVLTAHSHALALATQTHVSLIQTHRHLQRKRTEIRDATQKEIPRLFSERGEAHATTSLRGDKRQTAHSSYRVTFRTATNATQIVVH